MEALALQFSDNEKEAGLDEAGRGCLAGPVVAAAVILPQGYTLQGLTDSKKINEALREELRAYILRDALAWGIGVVDAPCIDEVNILNASYEAMHRALDVMEIRADFLAVDGNRFRAYPGIAHACLVKGDARFLNIAAASILAKTHRDQLMRELHEAYPQYGWSGNKGYPTKKHKQAIAEYGPSPLHRRSFNWSLPSK